MPYIIRNENTTIFSPLFGSLIRNMLQNSIFSMIDAYLQNKFRANAREWPMEIVTYSISTCYDGVFPAVKLICRFRACFDRKNCRHVENYSLPVNNYSFTVLPIFPCCRINCSIILTLRWCLAMRAFIDMRMAMNNYSFS